VSRAGIQADTPRRAITARRSLIGRITTTIPTSW
jgi:hypothetical protein